MQDKSSHKTSNEKKVESSPSCDHVGEPSKSRNYELRDTRNTEQNTKTCPSKSKLKNKSNKPGTSPTLQARKSTSGLPSRESVVSPNSDSHKQVTAAKSKMNHPTVELDSFASTAAAVKATLTSKSALFEIQMEDQCKEKNDNNIFETPSSLDYLRHMEDRKKVKSTLNTTICPGTTIISPKALLLKYEDKLHKAVNSRGLTKRPGRSGNLHCKQLTVPKSNPSDYICQSECPKTVVVDPLHYLERYEKQVSTSKESKTTQKYNALDEHAVEYIPQGELINPCNNSLTRHVSDKSIYMINPTAGEAKPLLQLGNMMFTSNNNHSPHKPEDSPVLHEMQPVKCTDIFGYATSRNPLVITNAPVSSRHMVHDAARMIFPNDKENKKSQQHLYVQPSFQPWPRYHEGQVQHPFEHNQVKSKISFESESDWNTGQHHYYPEHYQHQGPHYSSSSYSYCSGGKRPHRAKFSYNEGNPDHHSIHQTYKTCPHHSESGGGDDGGTIDWVERDTMGDFSFLRALDQ
ncbi:hypothetical protein Pmani_005800 [Petrolisthes manimaculis]|uniref:Uncharacterized protein n=1 Tax=Petrolisthes manimaculis TaxID=1843537 RepID=A0AAE1QC58_9EUCA|nr:hypothetical protein Pmani_005800 [Petrolisthes manimaculis]